MAPQASLSSSWLWRRLREWGKKQSWKLHWNRNFPISLRDFGLDIFGRHFGVCRRFVICVWRLGVAMSKSDLIRSSSIIVNLSQRFLSAEAYGVSVVSGTARLRRRRALQSGRQFSRDANFATCCLSRIGTGRLVTSVSRLEENEARDSSDVKSNEVEDVGTSFWYMAEGNMWVLEFGASAIRVLADPWLVDNQTFWDLPWLYSGRSESGQKGSLPGDLTWEFVNSVNAIIISQEWEDHCHIPTLKVLRKDIPVIASPKAAKIVQRLGFTDVRSVAHGTSTEIPGLQAWATVGGRVGPPWAARENGFVLQELQTGLRIYYEPHCSFDKDSVKVVSPVDVVITPGRQYKIAGFPLTESVDEAVHLLQILNPQVVLPIQLTHLEISGVTAPAIQLTGSVDEFKADLRKAGVRARIAPPSPSGNFIQVHVGDRMQD